MNESDNRSSTDETLTERQIFTSARHLKGQHRHDYLLSVCGEDTKMRKRIDSLLSTSEKRDPDLVERAFKSVLLDLHGSSNTMSPVDLEFTIDQVLDLFEPGDKGSIGRVNHYEIKELIGRGAFGVVFRALDTKLARMVAIKILAPTLSSIPKYRDRFLQEARSAAAVRHDNVVRIHDVEDSPFPYIVMELVNGETLRSLIRTHGPLPRQETLDLGVQIIRGLAAAHDKGIVHLDVKPANILLEHRPDGKLLAKLTDFGLALAIDGPGEVVPETVLGTPAYMAPEHARGESVDQRADLFSFGSVLYAMCSGQPAFIGGETLSILKGVVENRRAEIPEGVNISGRMIEIIDRLHSALPENRYESAQEVLHDLVALAEDRKRSPTHGAFRAAMVSLGIFTALAALALMSSKFFLDDGTEAVDTTVVSSVAPPAATWGQARQQLLDVTGEIEKIDPKFSADLCTYEIKKGKVLYVRMPFAFDLSPLASLVDVEHLFLEPPGPEREVPVGLDFISNMKQLRILELKSFPAKDLEPLRGLKLEKLDLWYSRMNAQTYPSLVDLDPLKGMPLNWLNCGGCGIQSLEPLRGMKLESLCLNFSKSFSDLSPLKGMPLYTLQINSSDVEDLTPLLDSPLKILEISNTKVSDLSPLIEMPLEELYIKGLQVDDLEVLKKCNIKALWMDYEPGHEVLIRSIPGLERLNGSPLEDFLAKQ